MQVKRLSPREFKTLQLAAQGLTDKEIARRLDIGLSSVRTYWNRIRNKLDVTNRSQAIAVVYGGFDVKGNQTSEERLRSVMYDRKLGLAIVDAEGVVLDANETFLKIVGRSRETMLKGHINRDLVTDVRYREADDRFLEELTKNGMAGPQDKEYVQPDGSRVRVLRSAVTLQDTNHMLISVLRFDDGNTASPRPPPNSPEQNSKEQEGH